MSRVGALARLRRLGSGLAGLARAHCPSPVRRALAHAVDRRLGLFAAAFVVGQVSDTVTTHAALASGRFWEANPLFAPALARHPDLAMFLKLGLALTVLVTALTKLAEPRRGVVLFVLAFISLQAPMNNVLRLMGVL